jgi:hypothetical protein
MSPEADMHAATECFEPAVNDAGIAAQSGDAAPETSKQRRPGDAGVLVAPPR